jgi:hypothetical protein
LVDEGETLWIGLDQSERYQMETITGRLDAEARASKLWYIGDPTLGETKSVLGGSIERK